MKTNNYPKWLVPVEIAEKLKEIGFDEPCLVYSAKHLQISKDLFIAFKDKAEATSIYLKGCEQYTNSYFKRRIKNINIFSIPTWGQVLEWFRNKGLFSYVDKLTLTKNKEIYKFYIKDVNNIISDAFNSYEEAREALIEKLIEIYINKNENNI